MLLPILSAILGIIAFLPVNFYSAGFVFLVPLFIFFLREEKFWRLVSGALIFKLAFYLGTIYFTLEPLAWGSGLLIFTGLPISVWLVKRFSTRFRSLFIIRYSLFIVIPFLWTFFDIIHAQYSLLPSYNIIAGNSLGSSPFLGLAVFGGPIALTFFAALINALAAAIFYFLKNKNRRVVAVFIAMILILLSAAYFISQNRLRKNSFEYNNLPNSIKIAAISTNEKFDRNQFEALKAELSGKRLDLVILPEDIFSSRTLPSGDQTEFFQSLAKELSADILAVFDTFSDGKKYNSAILFDKNGQLAGVHNKNRLTFIGEYWPFGGWRPSFYDWLAKTNPKIKNYAVFGSQNAYARGDENILEIMGAAFAAPICLEMHYPFDLKKYKENGARFIVNQTSNRWIGKGAKHFLYITNNLRKIESVWLKLPIISSGVKDYSGVIMPDNQTRLIDYQAGGKNYSVFFGEIKY